jgi:hypothetical protein
MFDSDLGGFMKSKLIDSIRGNFILTILFMVILTLVAIIPYQFNLEFWERNTFMTVIAGILGFISMVLLLANFFSLSYNINPFSKVINAIAGLDFLLLLFLIELVIKDDTSIESINRVVVFEGVLVFIILTHLFSMVWLKRQSTKKVDQAYQDYLKDHTIDDAIGGDTLSFLVTFFLTVFVGSTLFALHVESIIDYIIVGVFNAFFIYRIVTVFGYNKRQTVIWGAFSTLLFGVSVTLLVLFNDFFSLYVVSRAFIIVLPILMYVPRLMKMHYILMWKTYYES